MMDDGDEGENHAVRNLVLSVCDLKQHGDGPSEKMLGQAVTIGTRLYAILNFRTMVMFLNRH